MRKRHALISQGLAMAGPLIAVGSLMALGSAEHGQPTMLCTQDMETSARRPNAGTALGSRWRDDAAASLIDARRVNPPFSDRGAWLAHEAAPTAYLFAATAGQSLEIELARAAITESPYDDGPIFIDLYQVERGDLVPQFTRLGNVATEPGRLEAKLPRTGEYLVRMQPDPLVNAYFGLSIELSAALVFPVLGQNLTAVRSVFGDQRDGGARLRRRYWPWPMAAPCLRRTSLAAMWFG
jgi:hypothetical protein